jgi:hypothetical protein
MGTRTFTFTLSTDAEGYVGRQCTDDKCRRYFKVKTGTGLSNQAQAFCPYCGHGDKLTDFLTDEQKDYVLSLVGNQVMKEAYQQLKRHEFDIKPKGAFGIGMSLKISHTPEPIRYYVEKEVETHLVCAQCTLHYSIYGVFAFCPDCRSHNSLQILQKNLEVILKLLRLGEGAEPDVAEQLISDAIENAVSAFDGFGREVCRIAADRSSEPKAAADISFQNIDGARKRVQDLFQVDISASLSPEAWKRIVICFQKRHLIAHKMGVIDERYAQLSGDPDAIVGRKVLLSKGDAEDLNRLLQELGKSLADKLSV